MRTNWYSASRGFILPTVVIAAVVLMVVLTVTSQTSMSTSASLDTLDYNDAASDAAESGILRANACIEQNGTSTIVWIGGTALYPGASCAGTTSCSDPSCYIISQSDMRTYFKVVSDTTSTGIVTLTSYGYTDLLRQDGSVWKTYTTSAKRWNATVGLHIPAPVIQTITTASCPSARTRVQDARDSHTYWVQKLADGKCWMLTNLAYGGGGTNTYGDTKSITNSNTLDYTKAYYVIPTGSNVTTEPTDPSTSTDGTGQYGYLYNWCAAMGAPISTDPNPSSACANATTPAPDTSRSICPSGWRLPTGQVTTGELTALNNTVNAGSTSSDSGLITSPWLGQRSGNWNGGFNNQGAIGYYWSSTQNSATNGYSLYFYASVVNPAYSYNKVSGFAIRCVAAV